MDYTTVDAPVVVSIGPNLALALSRKTCILSSDQA